MNHRILLIERSTTLRHAASKLLAANKYILTVVSDFRSALQEVAAPNSHITAFDGIVFGWPGRTDPDADELLSLLEEPQNRQIAVLVLAHEADTPKLNWVTQRERSALLLWDDYQETIASLGALLQTLKIKKIREPKPKSHPISIRVLFVDDSPTVRVSFRKLLTRHGYTTDTASSVTEAMEMALERHYDIAIIDYFMPDETGDVLCRKLQENPRTANISTAIITGTYLDSVITSSLEAGAIECMFKSEANELFLARVDAMSRTVQVVRNIEKKRKRLEGILHSVGDGVYGLDDNGHISFINPAAVKILGYTDRAQIIGKSPYDLFHKTGNRQDQPLEQCKLARAYHESRPLYSWETIFQHKSGNTVPVECTILPMEIDGKAEGSVVAFRDVTDRKQLEEELKWQANHDALTKLPNRAYFEHQLNHEIKRLKRSRESSALLYLDLDRFKYLNDTAGHATGDRLLVEVGKKLSSRLRSADFLARLGGDEFAIILRNLEPKSAFEVADGFRKVLEDFEFECSGKYYNIGLTVGVNVLDAATISPGDALASADIACYIAKGKGRNQTHLYDRNQDGKAAMDKELGWSERLHRAIKNNEFILYFQPILPLADIKLDELPTTMGEIWQQYSIATKGKNRRYEVLIRLPDEQCQLIPPNAFVPTAERFNMMANIDRWVIQKAIEILSIKHIDTSTVLSINLSAQSMEDADLTGFVAGLLKHHRVNPRQLNFEVTETTAIENLTAANALISQLHELGCQFALDDFGSGYCSFSHLKNLPVDYIKIDGIFVQGLLNDPMDTAIVSSIVNIAHTVGKKTVAEYVENPETLRLLKEAGVDYVQGHYVREPNEDL